MYYGVAMEVLSGVLSSFSLSRPHLARPAYPPTARRFAMARSMHVVPFLKRGIHFPSHVAHPNHRLEEVLIRARGLIGHSNVVSLHIEDEKPRLVLGHRCGV